MEEPKETKNEEDPLVYLGFINKIAPVSWLTDFAYMPDKVGGKPVGRSELRVQSR